MALDIALKIYIPEKLALDEKVHRVVLPSDGKTLTVIKDRAPTLMVVDMGVVQILDEQDQVVEEYFVSGGAADIKKDSCTVLTEAAINRKDVDLAKARELYDEFANPFYKWLIDVLERQRR
ncbi:MAG: hypothetical protein NC218_09015 [Acetobacter sp.]|nr:hypothetical protein [Acetobacter sp.]